MSSRQTIAALAAASLLTASCGDELAEFRENELRPLKHEAEAHRARLAATLRMAEMRDRSDARLLKSQLTPLERTHRALAGLDPPDEFDRTYERFVTANAAFVAAMRGFIAALKHGDSQAMNAYGESAKQAVGAAQRALQPLDE